MSQSQHGTVRRLCVGAVVAFAAVAAPAAAQSTIDFESLAVTDGSGVRDVDNCYTERGLVFTVTGVACGTPASFGVWGAENPLFYTGSAALFNNSIESASVDITATGGRKFSLFRFDLASLLGDFGFETTVMFQGMLANGSMLERTFIVPGGTTMLTRYELDGFRNLTSARLTVTDPDFEPYVQFDNLEASVVPEPATVTLLATGLAGIAAAARRRRRNAAA